MGGTQGVLFFDDFTTAAVRGLAGILLILPGAVTDVLAVALLLPPIRLVVLWLLRTVLLRSVDRTLRTPPPPEARPAGGDSFGEDAGAAHARGPTAADAPQADQTPQEARAVEEGWVVRDVEFELVDDDEPPESGEEGSPGRTEH
jgi:UPF0716 family protein affecting phage T7 exclusion